MATKYRVYNELSEEEKAQITTEKQWRKRGYCPVENEGANSYTAIALGLRRYIFELTKCEECPKWSSH